MEKQPKGVEMATRITIRHDDLGDGVLLYEARDGEQLLWRGLGGSPVSGLLQILEHMPQRGDPLAPLVLDAE